MERPCRRDLLGPHPSTLYSRALHRTICVSSRSIAVFWYVYVHVSKSLLSREFTSSKLHLLANWFLNNSDTILKPMKYQIDSAKASICDIDEYEEAYEDTNPFWIRNNDLTFLVSIRESFLKKCIMAQYANLMVVSDHQLFSTCTCINPQKIEREARDIWKWPLFFWKSDIIRMYQHWIKSGHFSFRSRMPFLKAWQLAAF